MFDHSWAQACARYGERYYPKLQCCVPFTPVTGPRLLVRPGAAADTLANLAQGVAAVADTLGVSSAHVTFPSQAEAELLVQQGWLLRTGLQYHWRVVPCVRCWHVRAAVSRGAVCTQDEPRLHQLRGL